MHPIRKEAHYGTRVVSAYADRPSSIDDMFRHSVEAASDEVAVVEGAVHHTYRELDAAVDLVCANLARIGIVKGDRIGILLGNRIEFVMLLLACARLGSIAVPISTRLPKAEVDYICGHAGVAVLVHEADLAFAPPDVTHRFAVGAGAGDSEGTGGGSRPFGDLTAAASLIEAKGTGSGAGALEEDIFCICYTSGTTGRPKGALVTHLSALHGALHWVRSLGLTGRETMILAIPAAHIGGIGGVVLPCLQLGGRLVLMKEFKAKAFLDLAERERLSCFVGVPAMYNLCLLEPDLGARDLSAWHMGVCSGAPMPESILRKMAASLSSVTLVNAYGATEASSAITVMPPALAASHPASVGRVVACGELIVADETGREVPAGETGEIWVAGAMVGTGYWNDAAATAEAFVGGYWKSGDIGAIDGDGFVRVFDRKKDMINRGGLKIFAAEVERVLHDHPAVVEAAVVGVPDPVLGERVHAFVYLGRASATASDIREFCSGQIADYKVPEQIRLIDEPLPRNANGKLQKNALREIAAQSTRSVEE